MASALHTLSRVVSCANNYVCVQPGCTRPVITERGIKTNLDIYIHIHSHIHSYIHIHPLIHTSHPFLVSQAFDNLADMPHGGFDQGVNLCLGRDGGELGGEVHAQTGRGTGFCCGVDGLPTDGGGYVCLCLCMCV